jgi:hypothetical protein
MSSKETLDKAYGSIPKECTPYFDIVDFMPTRRSMKYYFVILLRKLTRK